MRLSATIPTTRRPLRASAISRRATPTSYNSPGCGARIGVLTDLFGTDPADAEVATAVREAVREMKGQSAEIVDVAIPGLKELLTDRADGFLVLRQDFKFDL